MAVRMHELLGLWRGDEDSCGYASEALAFEIASMLRPDCEKALVVQLYPHGDEPEPEIAAWITHAYKRYLKASKEGK